MENFFPQKLSLSPSNKSINQNHNYRFHIMYLTATLVKPTINRLIYSIWVTYTWIISKITGNLQTLLIWYIFINNKVKSTYHLCTFSMKLSSWQSKKYVIVIHYVILLQFGYYPIKWGGEKISFPSYNNVCNLKFGILQHVKYILSFLVRTKCTSFKSHVCSVSVSHNFQYWSEL